MVMNQTRQSYMRQDSRYIQAREKAKKVIRFAKILGGSQNSTYVKSTGSAFNGIENPDLNQTDLARLFSAISDVENCVKSYKRELKRISGK